MSQRYLGGVITANPTTPTMTSESGVWTLEQQFQYTTTWSPKIVGDSLRFRSSASAYLNRTFGTPTSKNKFTYSFWAKLGTNSTYNDIRGYLLDASTAGSTIGTIYLNGGLSVWEYNAGTLFQITESAVRRDPSAWYHFVVLIDTTLATSADRVQIWCNGVRSAVTGTQPSQNYNLTYLNTASAHNIGKTQYRTSANEQYDGLLAEINFVDGQALAPTSFGAYDSTGVWQPLPYTGTYGNNGFYLTFADNSGTTATTLGKDYSGNGNNWTPNNISLTAGTTYDWMLDSPTNFPNASTGIGNYCVLNPLVTPPVGSMTDGNLVFNRASYGSVTRSTGGRGTHGVSSGKFYFELQFTAVGSNGTTAGTADDIFGVILTTAPSDIGTDYQAYSGAWIYQGTGNKSNGSTTAYGSSLSQGDIVGVALDMDNGKIWFAKNGTWQASGDPVAGTNAAFTNLAGNTLTPVVACYHNGTGGTRQRTLNAGQQPFSYTPPSGFKALNTLNLPDPNITNGAQYMAATTYTGNGGSLAVNNGNNNTIGTTFKPDLIWAKTRSVANWNALWDSVRGGNNLLYSNATDAEASASNLNMSVSSTGWSMNGANSSFNPSGATIIAWQWQAGQGTTSSNTSGSITSTVSVNATAGFSVVTYTGNGVAGTQTVGHGLGVAPAMVIWKGRSASGDWNVNHIGIPSQGLILDLTAAAVSGSGWTGGGGALNYQNANTSTVFSLLAGSSNNNNVNTNGNTYVAYCWAAVAGFSAFGSYTGNGSADGPFVYCGFRPRWILFKRTDAVSDWRIHDTSRATYNADSTALMPNLSNAEDTGSNTIDVISNGFKCRDAGAFNISGGTYIYAAFAENPFKISRAR